MKQGPERFLKELILENDLDYRLKTKIAYLFKDVFPKLPINIEIIFIFKLNFIVF